MAFGPIKDGQYSQSVTGTGQGIAAAGGTIPNGAAYAEGYVRTASLVELRDNTTPTATKGKQWDPGDIIILRSADEINGIKLIRQGGTNATVDWEFFTQPPR